MKDLRIKYNASATLQKFHASAAFFRGIGGPIGSGKSVGCCMDIFSQATQQMPDDLGIRYARSVVIRNTLPQLESTTIKTWLDWFPESVFGNFRAKPPYTHFIKIKLPDGTKMDYEVIFLALDQEKDAAKLLSLEVTNGWINEAKEVAKVHVDHLSGRVGRYPSRKAAPAGVTKWPTRYGIIADTNLPDDDSWWYDYAEQDGWRRDPETGLLIPIENIPLDQRWEFFRQPSGLSPEAENIENLPPGYYQRLMAGKPAAWINVYVKAQYDTVIEGKPVFQGYYNPELHEADKLPSFKELKMYMGIDCSGRNPAAVFGQRMPTTNQIRAVHEFVCEDMGSELFAQLLKSEMNRMFPEYEFEIYGDPAGFVKGERDERTYAEVLKANGIMVRPSPVMRLKPRLEACRSLFMRNTTGGVPAVVLSKACKVLTAGMAGGYKFKKIQASGEARYGEEPEKNKFSHPQDAYQYMICGMGEYNKMLGRNNGGSQKQHKPAANLSSARWKVLS